MSTTSRGAHAPFTPADPPSPPQQAGRFGWRSARLDALVLGGWICCAAAGQWATSAESPALEWFAALWLWLGMLLVRPVWCLPLLLLTAPVFMCEYHRPWAWVQPVAAWVLLVRVALEDRFPARQVAAVAGVVAVVLLLSWPRDGVRLLAKYASYPRRQMLEQWLGPQASWAAFPFRCAVDRALAAALVSLLVLSGRYLSGRRVWTALWLSALLMLLGAYGPVLVPGHAPHVFLGTSNHGLFVTSLFHGAGYTMHYLDIGIAAGVAYFFLPLRTPDRPIRFASATLLLPVLTVRQRVIPLAFVALAVLAFALWAAASWRRRGRPRAGRPAGRRSLRGRSTTAAAVALCLAVVVAWGWKLNVADPSSELRLQLRARAGSFFDLKALPPSAYYPSQGSTLTPPPVAAPTTPTPSTPSTATPSRAEPAGAGAGRAQQYDRTLLQRLGDRLTALDDTRGPMWILGARTILREHVWRGAGAGTWARFHRSQPRPTRLAYAHMHNAYLDFAYEYGLVPATLLFVLAGLALVRLARSGGGKKAWLFYLAGLAAAGMGQHLLYSFSSMVATLPAAIVLARELLRSFPAGGEPAG